MLKRVYIKNWGILKESNMSLGSGMITITGETGSGKTLIMNALSNSLELSWLQRKDTESIKSRAIAKLKMFLVFILYWFG